MEKEIIDWYSERHFQPEKVIAVGNRTGIPSYHITEAMIHCYNKIKDGKPVEDIEVGRYTLNVARDLYSKNSKARFISEDNYTLRIKGLIYPLYAIVFLLSVTFLSYKIWW